jgi:S-methylmethionine-dependent homocysteine/selenocysteine methylase
MKASATPPRGVPIVMDGGMGSELELRGVHVPRAPWWSAWNLKYTPESVSQIHADYVAAGATIHTTNTFRTKRSDIGTEWRALTELAYQLCRRAIPAHHRVAGSISPVRDCYDRSAAPHDAFVFHREAASLLASLGVDVLLCETFASVDEALTAVSECVRTGTATWVSFTSGPQNNLLSPYAFAQAARRAVDAGAECVIIGCTPAVSILPYLQEIATLPVRKGVLANAGCVEDGIGWADAPRGPEVYARMARSWFDAGASVIGGCCGIRPVHIRAVAEVGWGGSPAEADTEFPHNRISCADCEPSL